MDNIEKYKVQLSARIEKLRQRIDDEKIVETYFSFEILVSLFDAYDSGATHEEIMEAFPNDSWREDTVTIPKELIRPLFEGWMKYRDGPVGMTLGNAFGLEGGGQGRSPVRKINSTLDAEQKRSNLVVRELLYAEKTGTSISQEDAFYAVTEELGISFEAVKSAFLKYGKETMRKLEV